MTLVIRPRWSGSEEQSAALNEAVDLAQKARELEDALWQAVRRTRELGVPDTVICRRAEISRATLNRRFGKRSDGAE